MINFEKSLLHTVDLFEAAIEGGFRTNVCGALSAQVYSETPVLGIKFLRESENSCEVRADEIFSKSGLELRKGIHFRECDLEEAIDLVSCFIESPDSVFQLLYPGEVGLYDVLGFLGIHRCLDPENGVDHGFAIVRRNDLSPELIENFKLRDDEHLLVDAMREEFIISATVGEIALYLESSGGFDGSLALVLKGK